MNRLSSLDRAEIKKSKEIAEIGGSEWTQENEEALRRFAELKVSARTATAEEMQQVVSILHRWKVSQTYEDQIPSLMPELYCFLQVVSKHLPSRDTLVENLPSVMVSTVLSTIKS